MEYTCRKLYLKSYLKVLKSSNFQDQDYASSGFRSLHSKEFSQTLLYEQIFLERRSTKNRIYNKKESFPETKFGTKCFIFKLSFE